MKRQYLVHVALARDCYFIKETKIKVSIGYRQLGEKLCAVNLSEAQV